MGMHSCVGTLCFNTPHNRNTQHEHTYIEHTYGQTHANTHTNVYVYTAKALKVTKKLKGQSGAVQIAALGSLTTAMRTLKEAQGALR